MSIFSNILDKLGFNKKKEEEEKAKAAQAASAAAAQSVAKPAAPVAPKPAAPAVPPAGPQGLGPRPPVGQPPYGHGTFTPGQHPVPTSVSVAEAAATAAAAVKPVEIPMVDVVSHLDNLAKASPITLNWKMSINDLMALLGLPHTPQDIKDLAVELGCPEKEMADSYSRNVWTHQTLLKRIAENGGNIPKELLD
jgi:hypothetical protein